MKATFLPLGRFPLSSLACILSTSRRKPPLSRGERRASQIVRKAAACSRAAPPRGSHLSTAACSPRRACQAP